MFASVDVAASAEERTRSPPSPEHDPESAAMERCVKRGLNAARVRRAIELTERDVALLRYAHAPRARTRRASLLAGHR
jgi:hypothetical protein